MNLQKLYIMEFFGHFESFTFWCLCEEHALCPFCNISSTFVSLRPERHTHTKLTKINDHSKHFIPNIQKLLKKFQIQAVFKDANQKENTAKLSIHKNYKIYKDKN